MSLAVNSKIAELYCWLEVLISCNDGIIKHYSNLITFGESMQKLKIIEHMKCIPT